MHKTIALLIILLLLASTCAFFYGCSGGIDPEIHIDDDHFIWSHWDETTKTNRALVRKDSDGFGYHVIIQKNFIAYAKTNESLILCEELQSGERRFWVVNLYDDAFSDYDDINPVYETVGVSELEWSGIWTKDAFTPEQQLNK
jgi:hypothetical protein